MSSDRLTDNTLLTKEWLLGVMEEYYGEKGEIKEISALGADAHGYMSTMKRVQFEWSKGRGDKAHSVIIKIPNSSSAEDAWAESSAHDVGNYGEVVIRMMHRTECRVYSKLVQYPEFKLSIPFMYKCLNVDTPTPIIVMEDLENCMMTDLVEGFTEKQLFLIVDELVKIHALSYKHPEVIDCGIIQEDSSATMNAFPALVSGVAEQMYTGDSQFFHCIKAFRDNFLVRSWLSEMNETAKKDPLAVLVHGDIWCPQILWRNKDEMGGIVDWALAHRGTIVEDLLHVITTCISVELRHLLTSKLLDYYHFQLEEKLKSIGLKIPFTRQHLQEEYTKGLPHASALAIFACGMWTNSEESFVDNQNSFSEIVLKKGLPNDKERMREIEKRCRAIVEETNEIYRWK